MLNVWRVTFFCCGCLSTDWYITDEYLIKKSSYWSSERVYSNLWIILENKLSNTIYTSTSFTSKYYYINVKKYKHIKYLQLMLVEGQNDSMIRINTKVWTSEPVWYCLHFLNQFLTWQICQKGKQFREVICFSCLTLNTKSLRNLIYISHINTAYPVYCSLLGCFQISATKAFYQLWL